MALRDPVRAVTKAMADDDDEGVRDEMRRKMRRRWRSAASSGEGRVGNDVGVGEIGEVHRLIGSVNGAGRRV